VVTAASKRDPEIAAVCRYSATNGWAWEEAPAPVRKTAHRHASREYSLAMNEGYDYDAEDAIEFVWAYARRRGLDVDPRFEKNVVFLRQELLESSRVPRRWIEWNGSGKYQYAAADLIAWSRAGYPSTLSARGAR